ncbi:methyltransferase domain-containing protein [Rhodococcus opacus]|uniref:methyltransferase domain-containing protein n=1 Tax=Rhodococcus opacus TaxID=37919 RepID=UPI000CF985DB|nr:methyltransferase domain-containing protein [Rhodococcus opacus]
MARGDVIALPVADAAADAVVAVNVLDHLDRPELGLREAYQPWDASLIALPDRDAVRDFLQARLVPHHRAELLVDALADRGPLPLPLTKRGALILARRAS